LGAVGLAGVADTTIKYFERKKEESRLTDIQAAHDDVAKPLPPPNPTDPESQILFKRAQDEKNGNAARLAYLNHETDKLQVKTSSDGKTELMKVGEKEKFRFSQITASPDFHSEGNFSGKTIGKLTNEIREGTMSAKDIPIEYVVIDGNSLIVNTRSSLALTRAGILQTEWILVNKTSDALSVKKIKERLADNGLTSEGTSTLRITQAGSQTSNLK
jgi:hypothetical protein